MCELKLPNVPGRHARRSARNEWLVADLKEKARSAATIALILLLLGAGIWLVVHGLRS